MSIAGMRYSSAPSCAPCGGACGGACAHHPCACSSASACTARREVGCSAAGVTGTHTHTQSQSHTLVQQPLPPPSSCVHTCFVPSTQFSCACKRQRWEEVVEEQWLMSRAGQKTGTKKHDRAHAAPPHMLARIAEGGTPCPCVPPGTPCPSPPPCGTHATAPGPQRV